MARYIIERNVGPITQAELEEAGKKSNQVLSEMPGVVWIRSHVSLAEGKIYCEYDAPDEESIRDHAQRAGLPADRISRLSWKSVPRCFSSSPRTARSRESSHRAHPQRGFSSKSIPRAVLAANSLVSMELAGWSLPRRASRNRRSKPLFRKIPNPPMTSSA